VQQAEAPVKKELDLTGPAFHVDLDGKICFSEEEAARTCRIVERR
jgi:hypothetical protein